MKNLIVLIIGLMVCGLGTARGQSAIEIIKKSQEITRTGGIESVTTLEIHDGKGNVRTRQTSMASRVYTDGTEKRIILFLSPSDVKGIGMLIYDYPKKDDDMWLYMPALRKTRKIVSSEKSRSFMGSEFSNADLAVASLEEFNYELSGSEEIDGTACWIIEAKPQTPAIGKAYNISSKTMWVAKKDFVPRKTLLVNSQGKEWKEIKYDQIKSISNNSDKLLVGHMEIKNLLNGRFSVMNMDQVQENARVDESYFTQSFLEQQQ